MSLAKNTFFLYTVQLSNYVVPILIIPIFIKYLGLEKTGELGLCLGVIYFIAQVSDLGFQNFLVDRLVRAKKIGALPQKILYAACLLKLGVAMILTLLAAAVLHFKGINGLAIISTSLAALAASLMPVWYFQAMEKSLSLAVANLVGKAVYLLWVLFSIDQDSTIEKILTGLAMSLVLAVLISLSVSSLKLTNNFPTKKHITQLFWSSFPYFTARASTIILMASNMLIVGFVWGDKVAGLYYIADQLLKAGMAFASPINQALYPFLVRTKKLSNYAIIVIGAACLGCVLAALFWPAVIYLFHFIFEVVDEFDFELKIIAVTVLVNFLSRSIGFPIFSLVRAKHIVNISSYIGLTVYFFLWVIVLANQGLNQVYVVLMISLITELSILSSRSWMVVKKWKSFRAWWLSQS